MTVKVTLEHEEGKRAIAVYRDGDLMVHYWLIDSEDEYRLFDILTYTVKKLEGW